MSTLRAKSVLAHTACLARLAILASAGLIHCGGSAQASAEPAGTERAEARHRVTACTGSAFGAPLTTQVDGGPLALAIADFNRDGHLDVASGNWSGHSVSIMLGAGDATLGTPLATPLREDARAMVTADFNADGNPDLAVGAEYGIHVMLGRGDGTFAAPTTLSSNSAIFGIATADLDGDGRLDLLAADGAAAGVDVLLGHGDGTFGTPVILTGIGIPMAIVAGDFDGDGYADAAVATDEGYAGLFHGAGDGTLTRTYQYKVGTRAGTQSESIAASDLNGDGHLDLVVGNIEGVAGSGFDVLLGNGDGTFATPVGHSQGPHVMGIGVADFDLDGHADIVMTHEFTSTVGSYFGAGDGTFVFGDRAPATVAEDNWAIVAADLNEDGLPDAVVAGFGSNQVSVLPGTGCKR